MERNLRFQKLFPTNEFCIREQFIKRISTCNLFYLSEKIQNNSMHFFYIAIKIITIKKKESHKYKKSREL